MINFKTLPLQMIATLIIIYLAWVTTKYIIKLIFGG